MSLKQTNIKFSLESGQESLTMDLKGYLESFIVSSVNKISIIIKSSLGYLLLHQREHEGTKYYAPRAHAIAPEPNLIHQYQFDRFLLNEQIEIIVSGRKGEEVNISVRLDE